MYIIRSICNATVLVLLTGYREGFSIGFICVWQCMRLAARGQVLLTNLLVNAKNVDPRGLRHHRWNISSWLQWLAAQSVRIFVLSAYKLLMKQTMMSLPIGYLERYFSGHLFQLYCIIAKVKTKN